MAQNSSTQWAAIPPEDTIQNTIVNLGAHHFVVYDVPTKEAALQKIKDLIPDTPVSVMTGSSTTLYQIGFMDYYLSDTPKWDKLGPKVFAEKDPVKQADLRRKADMADYFLASVNAVTQDGLLLAVDRSGSRVSALPFVAKQVILVVGAQKITPTLDAAFDRIRKYVYPLEDARAKKAYGTSTGLGKWVILENEFIPNRTHVILVRESLGF